MEVFSTAYLPGIHYIRQYIQSPVPIIDLGEHYLKQTHRNRAVICSSNGALSLIIPLRKPVNTGTGNKRTGDMQISYAEDWQSQHLKAIRSCYKNSPYYEHYQPEFEEIILAQPEFLHELNNGILNWLLIQLDMAPKHEFSNVYLETKDQDYRNFDYFNTSTQPYKQVFSDRNGFLSGLSVIDLLFNKGPETMNVIYDFGF